MIESMATSKHDPLPEHGPGGLPPLPEEPPFLSGKPDTPPPDTKKAAAPAEKDVMHTRAGSWWTALIVGALFLAMLLAFILQNLDKAPIRFLFWRWEGVPLGVSLLGAAILGVLLTACFGGIRIMQLRRAAKKKR